MTTLPTIFEICEPREDVVRGNIQESDFAADLAQVLRGHAPDEYKRPEKFFANTHPTRGLKDLLRNVSLRLNGAGGGVASIFRLDTQYGGGKTHALIALSHVANGMKGVTNIAEFMDATLVPRTKVHVAAFDGENADPMNGRMVGDGIRAFTPWGELAYALGGKTGYQRVSKSDEACVAPGADTLRELFQDAPALILLDELSVYLRKIKNVPGARDQLTAFLTSLFKAVEGTKNSALVFTLAIGKEGKATDAYGDENLFVADRIAEAESVAARKATLLDPTAEDETAQVLRRRLFAKIDEDAAARVVDAYRAMWQANKDRLPKERVNEDRAAEFLRGYPLHPALMATLTDKLATLGNFQRVRGMLRLLARTVARLWQQKPKDAHAIHLNHIDPGYEPLRQEIVTRLGLPKFDPPIRNDVASPDEGKVALGQELDARHYVGLAPYGSYVARTILLNTLAFNENLKGCTPDELQYAVMGPGTDVSFIEDARKRFVSLSAYLDDRPNVPMRFLTEANLTQIVRRQEAQVDPGEVRTQLTDRIKSIFGGQSPTLDLVPFASAPNDVDDDVGDGRPHLVLIGYDAESVRADAIAVPQLVERIFRYRGAAGSDFRRLVNNLVFLVADDDLKDEMRKKMVRRLALDDLRRPERLQELAEHQRDRVMEWFQRSEQEVAVAVQQCFRHLFYPSKNRIEGAAVDLAHAAFDVQSASERPGVGQQQVLRSLRENNKLRMGEDNPDSPTYIRDRTPLKKGQITTLALRGEFRKDVSLPMLIGDDIFVKAIRNGVEGGHYVYQSGDLLLGKGDPWATIKLDEQSVVYTMEYAKEKGIWPRPEPEPKSIRGGGGTAIGGGDVVIGGGSVPPGKTKSQPPGPKPPEGTMFEAEGPLREALTRIWEQARGKKVKKLGVLRLRLFDPADAFRLLGAVGAVPGAEKTANFHGAYQTNDGGELELNFTGPVQDAQPVKDFLEPQLRAAKDQDFTASFSLRFGEGLSLEGDGPEKLGERLARFATGAAFIEAEAEAAI